MKKLLVAILFASISSHAEMIMRTKVLMGTFVTISLDEKDKSRLSDIFKILVKVDKSLSSYDKNSPIYRLNHEKQASLNLYAYEALTLSKHYYEETDGYFDVAIGSITKDLYRFGENERVPTRAELNASVTSLSGLKFDNNSATVSQSVKIDLGGMGKGFGVDKVAQYLRDNSVKKAKIALSGDIRCFGICEIFVNDPFSQKPLSNFYTRKEEMGISTSGNYNRYVKETKNNHLINPKTKKSQSNFISITLISQLRSSDLDAYATAVSVMSKDKAYDFLNSHNLAYIVLDSQKKLVVSKNINDYVRMIEF